MRRRITALFSLIICCFCLFSGLSHAAEPKTRQIVNAWCLDLINAPLDAITGESPVKIAVIDSGMWADNPYIRNERIAPGYNYALKGTVTNDLIGHGSQTTAIIIGAKSEGRELVGLGSHSTIVPLVWITKYPSKVVVNGGVAALCSAIRDSVDTYGCQIINVSSGISSDEPELREAVAYAEEKGAILISAAGNRNQSAPDEVFYPASYATVVGVGSVNEEMLVSDFSQRNTGVMVTAPGENVYSLSPDIIEEFTEISGTSYSTAHVSGFAALLLSHHPEMTPAEFRQILEDSSRDLGDPGYDTAYGYGLIDVSKGLLLAAEQESTVPGDAESGGTGPAAFSDISGWYEEHVLYLAERGIVTGKSGTLFAPTDGVTRAEFAAMLARMGGEDLPASDEAPPSTGKANPATGETPPANSQAPSNDVFSDVASADWSAPYVSWAARTGIAQGYGGSFLPNNEITRQDMAVMLTRFAEYALAFPLPDGDVPFDDKSSIADYALSSVGKLLKAGIIDGGSSNRFDPFGVAKRCEAAKVCAILLQVVGR